MLFRTVSVDARWMFGFLSRRYRAVVNSEIARSRETSFRLLRAACSLECAMRGRDGADVPRGWCCTTRVFTDSATLNRAQSYLLDEFVPSATAAICGASPVYASSLRRICGVAQRPIAAEEVIRRHVETLFPRLMISSCPASRTWAISSPAGSPPTIRASSFQR